MTLKECIKQKICLLNMVPNYPLGEFVKWIETEQIEIPVLSLLLDELQAELDAESHSANHNHTLCSSQFRATRGYWCLYCSQVRAYYKAIIHDPNNKERLLFLLQ